MEIDIRYISANKYIEVSITEGNSVMKSGLLDKREALLLKQQFEDAFSELSDMWEATDGKA